MCSSAAECLTFITVTGKSAVSYSKISNNCFRWKSYHTNHYNLKAIIAVGNKDDSPRTVDFEKGRMELQKSLQLRAIL